MTAKFSHKHKDLVKLEMDEERIRIEEIFGIQLNAMELTKLEKEKRQKELTFKKVQHPSQYYNFSQSDACHLYGFTCNRYTDDKGIKRYKLDKNKAIFCRVQMIMCNTIIIVFKDGGDLPFPLKVKSLYCLQIAFDPNPYNRMLGALTKLALPTSGYPGKDIIKMAFKEKDKNCYPRDKDALEVPKSGYFNEKLDDCQKNAVNYCVNMLYAEPIQTPLSVVHGCPGSGKTTVVIELIRQAIQNNNFKVLVCAASNAAVDNIGDRLLSEMGLLKLTLNGLEHNSEILSLRLSRVGNFNRFKSPYMKGYAFDVEIHRTLFEEIQHNKQPIHTFNVVIATLIGIGKYIDLWPSCFLKPKFDLLIIDECGQAFEAACWIPLLYVKRCVLVGDYLQLPPTVLCPKANTIDGLQISMMERIISLYRKNLRKDSDKISFVIKLNVQYRMNSIIAEFISERLYENSIITPTSIAKITLRDLLPKSKCQAGAAYDYGPLVLVDTSLMFESLAWPKAPCSLNMLKLVENREAKPFGDRRFSKSSGNMLEVELVFQHLQRLLRYNRFSVGLSPEDIGIISPYLYQIELLKRRISKQFPAVEISTVDSYQGREKEVIIISLVRSNAQGMIGFLKNARRMNVAITRAKRHVCIICDSATMIQSKFIVNFLSYIRRNGQTINGFTGKIKTTAGKCAILMNYLNELTLATSLGAITISEKSEVRVPQVNKNGETKTMNVAIGEKDSLNKIRDEKVINGPHITTMMLSKPSPPTTMANMMAEDILKPIVSKKQTKPSESRCNIE